ISSVEKLTSLQSAEKKFQHIVENNGGQAWKTLIDATSNLMLTQTKSFIETAILTLKVKLFIDQKEKGEDHQLGLTVDAFLAQLKLSTQSELQTQSADAIDELIILDANLWQHHEMLHAL